MIISKLFKSGNFISDGYSLEQVYENSAPIDNYVDNNITTEIESAYTIIGTDTFEAA